MSELEQKILALELEARRFRRGPSRPRRGHPWPEDFQQKILALVGDGVSPHFISRRLRIPVQTFYHWRRRSKSSGPRRCGGEFLEIPVAGSAAVRTAAEGAPGLRIVTERGHEVLGLEFEQLARLLRDEAL